MKEFEPDYRYPDAPVSLVLWYGKEAAEDPDPEMISTEPMFEAFIHDLPEVDSRSTIRVLTALRLAILARGKRDDDPNVAIHRNGVTLKRPFTYKRSPVMQGTGGMGPKTTLLLQHLAHYAQLGYEKTDMPEVKSGELAKST